MNKLVAVIIMMLFSMKSIANDLTAQFTGSVDVTSMAGVDDKSWLQQGWGTTRYNSNDNDLIISRASLISRIDFSNKFSFHGTAQYQPQPQPDIIVGLTEAYLEYKPIAKGYQVSAKMGAFYPKMSLENTDMGWSSPYTYHFSALNAWIGEEVRAIGTELSIKRPARRFRSKYDVNFFTSVFKGNDPAGTLIAWRGLLPHDRQTVLNERIGLAPLYSFQQPELAKQQQYSDPFHEVDGRFGYYVGTHIEYLRKHYFRVYWYDNNADSSALNESIGQYAWDTRFLNFAWKSKITKSTHLVIQGMLGSTTMARKSAVYNNFNSWFVLFSHRWAQYRFSARIEQSKVIDKDSFQSDPNASNNRAVTFHINRSISERWKFGAEFLYSKSFLSYRYQSSLPLDSIDKVWRATLSYEF